jgi:predicted RecB family nuclease
MGRHATREAEVDRLLRAGRFVDLHAIVRQSLRASVEEYSIKNWKRQRLQEAELLQAGAPSRSRDLELASLTRR